MSVSEFPKSVNFWDVRKPTIAEQCEANATIATETTFIEGLPRIMISRKEFVKRADIFTKRVVQLWWVYGSDGYKPYPFQSVSLKHKRVAVSFHIVYMFQFHAKSAI